jgi:hypothetical protein
MAVACVRQTKARKRLKEQADRETRCIQVMCHREIDSLRATGEKSRFLLAHLSWATLSPPSFANERGYVGFISKGVPLVTMKEYWWSHDGDDGHRNRGTPGDRTLRIVRNGGRPRFFSF